MTKRSKRPRGICPSCGRSIALYHCGRVDRFTGRRFGCLGAHLSANVSDQGSEPCDGFNLVVRVSRDPGR